MLPARENVLRMTQDLLNRNYNFRNVNPGDGQIALELFISLNYALKQKEFFAEEYAKYYEILQNAVTLANELHLDNSMKLSCFFDFLLKNGFFSVHGRHRYFCVNGNCPLDIMKGVGVCRHYSAMLIDLMTKANYPTADIFCNIDSTKSDIYEGHAVTLIEDSGELYIFDATNSEFLKIIDTKKATTVDLSMSVSIDIKRSLLYPRTIEEANLLYDYAEGSLPNKNLNAKAIYAIEGQTREAIKEHMPLIQDFYTEIHPDLQSIVTGVSRKREKGKESK